MQFDSPLPDDRNQLNYLLENIDKCLQDLTDLHRTLDFRLDLEERSCTDDSVASPAFDALLGDYQRELNLRMRRFSTPNSLISRYIGHSAIQELSNILIGLTRLEQSSIRTKSAGVSPTQLASILSQYRGLASDFEGWLRHLRELRDRVFDKLGSNADPAVGPVVSPASTKKPRPRVSGTSAREAERIVADWFRKSKHKRKATIRMIHQDTGLAISSIQKTSAWRDFQSAKRASSSPRSRNMTNTEDYILQNTPDTRSSLDAAEFAILKHEYFESISPKDQEEFKKRPFDNQIEVLKLLKAQQSDR